MGSLLVRVSGLTVVRNHVHSCIGRDVLAELPDEVEGGEVGSELGARRAHAASVDGGGDAHHVRHERVGRLLQRWLLDVTEPLEAKAHATPDLADAKRWTPAGYHGRRYDSAKGFPSALPSAC